jgi:hypothetical protein
VSSTSPEKPSETPEPTEPAAPEEPASDARPEPEEHLLVDPARVRRAPRYRAFFTIGALVGIVGGLIFGVWLASNVDPSRGDIPLQKPGVYITVIVASSTTVTLLVAGLLAILADRRSLRRR